MEASFQDGLSALQAILEVLPSGTDVEVTVDHFTHEVYAVEYAGDRFPICAINAEVSDLSNALDDIEAVTTDMFA